MVFALAQKTAKEWRTRALRGQIWAGKTESAGRNWSVGVQEKGLPTITNDWRRVVEMEEGKGDNRP
jgi:hypothetical protein